MIEIGMYRAKQDCTYDDAYFEKGDMYIGRLADNGKTYLMLNEEAGWMPVIENTKVAKELNKFHKDFVRMTTVYSDSIKPEDIIRGIADKFLRGGAKRE